MPTVTAAGSAEAAAWDGWGTALKPAIEPIVMARKPIIGTVASNVLEYGVGGINIDGCRVQFAGAFVESASKEKNAHGDFWYWPLSIPRDG